MNQVSSAKVEHIDAGPVVYFTPLNDQDRIDAGLKFNLVFKTETHKVVNFGIGLPCKSPPEITIESLWRWCMFVQFNVYPLVRQRHIQHFN